MGWSSIGTVVGGGQLATAGGTPVQPVTDQLTSGDLGTGADGAVVLSANTTLVRDMQYSSLTVDVAVVLSTAGYVIRCQNTLTNDGIIANDGGDATATTPGAGAPTGSLLGGAAGALYHSGSTAGHVAGNNAIAADVQGGAGGSCVSADGGTGPYPGGSVTTSGALGLSMAGLRSLKYSGGASGAASAGAPSYAVSGGAGGVVIAFCGSTAGGGTWQADAGLSSGSGGSGGWSSGGSGGGVVYIATRQRGDTWTLSAAGGAGAGSAAGNAGATGYPGRTGILVCNGS